MKFGLVPVNIGMPGVEPMLALARNAESIGFESVWTFEHVIVPLDYRSKYPYSPTGKMGAAPETPFVDPLIALTAIAAATKKLRLGTGVNILSQTNPLLMAKQAASLDVVSNGRFMLGVGIGWLREEFDAMGVPFERRGARFDDYLTAMKKVWSGAVVEHRSEFLDWHGFKSLPMPVQKPLPIVIGGIKGKALERVARFGDGWFAPSASVEELGPMLAQLKTLCREHGRDYSKIEITTMWTPQAGLDVAKKLRDIGVGRLVLLALGPTDLSQLKRIADDVFTKI
jgi:probable F420-dependent oxidoreductase